MNKKITPLIVYREMGTIKNVFYGKSLQVFEEFKHIKHIQAYSGVNGHIQECFWHFHNPL